MGKRPRHVAPIDSIKNAVVFDPAPFVLTLTPQYVARVLGKTPLVSLQEIERYADEDAGDLREIALLEKGTGRLNLILE